MPGPGPNPNRGQSPRVRGLPATAGTQGGNPSPRPATGHHLAGLRPATVVEHTDRPGKKG